MTDRGTRVRWTTAALVAPAAAALFTGTTVWASGHEPATASTPTTAAAPAPAADPLVAALRAQIDQNTAQVDRLRQTVANLQAQAVAIAKGVAVPRTTSSRSTSSAPSSRTSSRTSSAPTTRSTTTAPAPAPAPVTHTTTGASGVVK